MAVEQVVLSDVPSGVEGLPTVAVASGRCTLYFTGQIGLGSDGKLAGDTIEEQSRQLFRNLDSAAKAAGVTPADIAHLTIHVVTDDFDDALAQVFAGATRYAEEGGKLVELYASTMVAVSALQYGALIEISAVAVLD